MNPMPPTSGNPTPCKKCGQPHPTCKAHTRAGNPCKQPCTRGMRVCRLHGGASPRAIEARDRAERDDEARADAARFSARTDIHPADALLELVQYQAGVVAYWRRRVEEVDADALEWGVTKTEQGTGPEGPVDTETREAGAHVAYRLLVEAQDKLAQYAAASLKAGVEERRVRMAEDQGQLVAGAIRSILDRLGLSPDQEALVPTVVPAALRAITASPEGAAS